MTRIRSIKPEWLDDEALALAPSDARVLSVALLLLADDYGNGRASSVLLSARVFPGLANPRETLAKALDCLVRHRFVTLYRVDGQDYYSVRNWTKHQKVDHPGKPLVPSPSDILANPRETLAKVSETLAPDQDQDQDQDQEESAPTPSTRDLSVRRVFEHWRQAMKRPQSTLTKKRLGKIVGRIKDVGEARCIAAIDGCASSAWYVERGRTDIELILRDVEHVEAFELELQKSSGAARPVQSDPLSRAQRELFAANARGAPVEELVAMEKQVAQLTEQSRRARR